MRRLCSVLVVGVLLASTVALFGAPAWAMAPSQQDPANGRASVEFTVAPRAAPTIGDLVTWDYVVENDTSFRVQRIVISDDLEGQICFIEALPARETKTCSVVTVASARSYDATATMTGRSVTLSGEVIREIEVSVIRSYVVDENSAAPADLAFTEPPTLPDGSSPAWPVDRWGPWVVVALMAAGIVVAAFRLQPEPEKARGSRS